MVSKGFLKNPVNLRQLKVSSFLNNPELNLVLKDDIWLRGILILRSGRYLTKDIIDKLINFGVNEINVHLQQDNYIQDEIEAVEELKKNFIRTQNILIINEDLKEIKSLGGLLKNIGFNENNIFGSVDIRAIDNYIQEKMPDYLFVEYDIEMESYIRTLRPFLVDTHVFMTAELNKNESDIKRLEDKSGLLDMKLIIKPVIQGHFGNLINQCIEQDFCRLLNNKDSDYSYKQSVGF